MKKYLIITEAVLLALVILIIFNVITNKYVIGGTYVIIGLMVFIISRLKKNNRI